MWSRRAQAYEAKINSGHIVAIAEVVRDLFRSDTQPEQSYSERQLYEAALDRLSREIAAVQRVTETEAVKEIEAALAKGPAAARSRPRKRPWSRTRRRNTSRDQRRNIRGPGGNTGPFALCLVPTVAMFALERCTDSGQMSPQALARCCISECTPPP
jgi:hypothetical protein